MAWTRKPKSSVSNLGKKADISRRTHHIPRGSGSDHLPLLHKPFRCSKSRVEQFKQHTHAFYIGLIMAYLLCPIYNWAVGWLFKLIKTKTKTQPKALKLSRIFGTVVALVVMFAVLTGFVMLIIPNLYESIVGLVERMPGYFDQTTKLIENGANSDNQIVQYIAGNMENLSEKITAWFEEKVLPASTEIVSFVSSRVVSTIKGVVNFFVAMIICVYILNSKEKFIAQGKKLILAIFSKERAARLFELGRLTNTTFGGFILRQGQRFHNYLHLLLHTDQDTVHTHGCTDLSDHRCDQCDTLLRTHHRCVPARAAVGNNQPHRAPKFVIMALLR